MKKRILCLVMALLLTLSLTGALAAGMEYDLPEKMELQFMGGSGIRGSLTMSAQGDSELAQLITALFQDTTLELRCIRRIDSEEYQLQAYFLKGEEQFGLTQLMANGTNVLLRSALAPDTSILLDQGKNLLEQVTAREGNPSWYSVLANFMNIDQDAWSTTWEPALAGYEQALEAWLTSFAAAPEVIREENEETRMQLMYEIPAAALKTEAVAMVQRMLGDETLRGLLYSLMTPEQGAAYLNAGWSDYYAQLIQNLELVGTITLERQMSLGGDVLYSKVLFPLAEEKWGYDTLMIYQEGDDLTVSLAGSKDGWLLSLEEKEEGVSGMSLRGRIEREVLEGEGSFKADYALLRTTRTNMDDENREHQYENFTLTLAPDEGESIVLNSVLHYYSKVGRASATTMLVDISLTQGDAVLSLEGSIRSAVPWVLQEVDLQGAQNYASLTNAEREAVWNAYLAGFPGMVQALAAVQIPPEQTQGEEIALPETPATTTDMTELPPETPAE